VKKIDFVFLALDRLLITGQFFSSIPGNEQAVSYARKHRDIIIQFGRFPHRNKILGRVSTPEEIEFEKVFGGF
jgi:uncharacterized protein (DUF924 family)